jgi:precorrin-2/cobalt-factor-2 C20-methyltransferase
MSGTLYGIGVGPGDPELITLKAHRILTAAKVVAYPAPDTGESFARSIVASYLTPEQTEFPIVIPMRSERFPAQSIYDRAAGEIARYLDDGTDVVVLCEGDPFFYGSFMYLFERLAGHFPVEVVPGISSVMAAGAAVGRPLAARNELLSVIPGPMETEEMRRQLEAADAAAIIKVGRHFPRIRDLIDEMGLTSASAYVERVTLGNQRLLPLAEVKDESAPYFSLILIYKGQEGWVLDLPVGASADDDGTKATGTGS